MEDKNIKIYRGYRESPFRNGRAKHKAMKMIEVKIVPIENKELYLILSSFMEIGKEEREIAFDILKRLDNISEAKAITILELCNKCIGNY